jgi:hypothetical protein
VTGGQAVRLLGGGPTRPRAARPASGRCSTRGRRRRWGATTRAARPCGRRSNRSSPRATARGDWPDFSRRREARVTTTAPTVSCALRT